MKYQVVIGLEIHSELKTNSKMFCSFLNDPNERHPNVNICPVCAGHPGTLPVINEDAVKKVIKTGLALNCKIQEFSKFDRKNYFYPDLPKGYQISQYDKPLCLEGHLDVVAKNQDGVEEKKRIGITRIHLEEDTGRLAHPEGADFSLVDFNRAGVPLMELVSEPDIKSGDQAKKFAEEFQTILRYLKISDADMEKGQMRVEVNISLNKAGEKFGTKVEIKNLNSFRSVEKSIDYEIKRQSEILGEGGKIIQETRGWNDVQEKTVSQREKEEAHDYRYFPEPDLPPLVFTKEEIERIKKEISELPEQRRKRFKKEYLLEDREIDFFIQNKDLGEYFEKISSEIGVWTKDRGIAQNESKNVLKLSANYIINDLQGLLKGISVGGEDFLITPENFAEFTTYIYEGAISSGSAKIILSEMFSTGKDPSDIIKEKDLGQVSEIGELEMIAKKIIEENPQAVDDYKKGKGNASQFLTGKAMAATKGKANPQTLQELFKNLLS